MSRFWAWIFVAFFRLSSRADESPPLPPGVYAEISTPRGTLWAELFFQRAPLTVSNFVGLAEGKLGPKRGTPFYDGLIFHRIVPGFVVQGGDPAGTGEGGPGYVLPDEFVPALSHDAAGVLSMANDGPDSNGSQFFITLAEVRRLDFLHSVFGRVVRGLEVLPRIQQGDLMTVRIHRIGEAARAFVVDETELQRLAATKPKSAPESAPAFFTDPENLLPQDPPRARTFQFKLANLARATGFHLYGSVVSGKGLSAEARDKKAHELASSHGVRQRGVLAVYFAEGDHWSIIVGSDEAMRRLGSAEPRELAERQREWLRAAERVSAVWISEAEKSSHGLDPKQRIKLKIDGVLNVLLGEFVQSNGAR